MAQFYTLEEAAGVLGMTPEDLKGKAQQREVRAFLDGGSWRFRVVDVDELARRRGMGSDAEMPLSDLDLPAPGKSSSDDIDLSEFQMGTSRPDLGSQTTELPSSSGSGSGSDHDILLDDLSLPPDSLSKSSSVIIGMHNTPGNRSGDSDVRLVSDHSRSDRPSDSDVTLAPKEIPPSDSDVRLASPAHLPSDSDVTLIAGDTHDHGALAGSGDTAIRPSPAPGSGSSGEIYAGDEPDSDFELTPSGVIDALTPDSGSDFELTALEEESSEFESTPLLKPSDSDVTAADPGFSGINLSRPSDSGIGLQMKPGFGLGDPESMELAPLSGITPSPVPAPKKPSALRPDQTSAGAKKPPAKAEKEKDIFDDTDFEVDALASDQDSDDRTVQLEAASDFELEDSEDTGSEVFAIDEDDVDQNAATALGPAVSHLDDEEEDDGFDEATSGEIEAGGWDVESESSSAAGRAATSGPVLASAAPSAEWGGLWVGMLGVATLFLLFLTFVSMDLIRNLYDFQGDSPASGIVKSLAGLISG